MKRLVFVLLAACASRPPPPHAESAVSGLQACADLPTQPAVLAADEHLIRFELRSALELSKTCFNSGGKRVAGEKKGDALVFPLHIKKTVSLVKYHLHATVEGRPALAYNNEIRASKHADDVVKLTVSEKDGQLDASQTR